MRGQGFLLGGLWLWLEVVSDVARRNGTVCWLLGPSGEHFMEINLTFRHNHIPDWTLHETWIHVSAIRFWNFNCESEPDVIERTVISTNFHVNHNPFHLSSHSLVGANRATSTSHLWNRRTTQTRKEIKSGKWENQKSKLDRNGKRLLWYLRSGSKDRGYFSWKPTIQHLVHKSLRLSLMDPLHVLISYLKKRRISCGRILHE